jgi:ABC-type uncharacterized transport system involved in gliding motility auxiliary subunit
MSVARQRTYAYGSLAVLLFAFVAAVIASDNLLRGVRLDLTENKLYTLSEGTRGLLADLAEPINLYYFFSERSTEGIQVLRDYSTRVSEMLEELVAASNGMLRLTRIDPAPFSEEEDRAAQFGLTDLGLGGLGGDSIYFGLAATNTFGDEAVIDVFDPDEESSLEYDLARLIYSLSTPEKSVVGLLSGVPMTGGFDPQTQQVRQPWIVNQHIRQLFEVRNLSAGLDTIADDISLLWIVHPSDLPEPTLYAIDQFLLRGGRALIFVDPYAEVAATGADPTGMGASQSSDLARLFDAWGLQYDPTMVVADNENALSVSLGAGRSVRHIGLIGLQTRGMAQDEIVTAGLDSVNLGTAGSLSVAEGAQIRLVPLLQSSAESALLPALEFQFLADPSTLQDGFSPGGERQLIAARLEGPLSSAFPDGPPGDDETLLAPPEGHLSASEQANVVVVADVDVLSDRLWVQMRRSLLGQQIATPFADNGDFLANAVSNLAGSEHLIGLQSRETYSRPFDRVEALRREADARFRATEQELEARLGETEQRLAELQAAREDSGSLFMNPEQQAELERFQQEQLRIRQELRSVRRELDSSIENLGTALKLINIVAFPLALALTALAVYLFGRARRGRVPRKLEAEAAST